MSGKAHARSAAEKISSVSSWGIHSLFEINTPVAYLLQIFELIR